MSANNKNKYNPQEPISTDGTINAGANNKNKYNPQELSTDSPFLAFSANNKNKYNPQELHIAVLGNKFGANNKNKYNPQEPIAWSDLLPLVQIIRINTILKNIPYLILPIKNVQIIRINTILKNRWLYYMPKSALNKGF